MAASMQTPNDLMTVFSNTVSAGFVSLQDPVNGLFGLMITLVVALTGIQWALSSNRDVLAGAFGKVLLIGFFAWLINDWERLSLLVQAGFVDLGLTAGGGGLSREDFLNPGAILQQGWDIVKALGETPAPVSNPLDVMGGLTDALILGLAMIGIMLAFAVLALQIIVTLLEFKIVTLGGFILLPFGIWSKSAFLTERPLGFVASSGLKVLALAIVVSGARAVFEQLQPSTNPDLYEALAILSASLLLAMLAIFIPNLASALVTGGPALGAGAAVTGALAVGGGAMLAAAGLGATAARFAGSSRTAANAGVRRFPGGPAGTTPPSRPSHDKPPRGGGGGPAGSAAEPAALRHGLDVESSRPPHSAPPKTRPVDAPSPRGRSVGQIQGEREEARRAFHRALQASDADGLGQGGAQQRRSAALQTFFAANAGRSLLPSGETSGTLSPQLKLEEP